VNPQVGDLWQYMDGHKNYRYLVTKIFEGTGDEEYLFETCLLCVDEGSSKNRYLWPRVNPRWRLVA
jgi:hypothetical protein